jgi:pimeloyl-ACP methyl ester carboxylesterase
MPVVTREIVLCRSELWLAISRTDVAGDLVALIRRLGGPAVIVGHSLSGGAATIAAATAPDLVSGIVEVGPFTRKVQYSMGGLLRIRRYRRGSLLMGGVPVSVDRSFGRLVHALVVALSSWSDASEPGREVPPDDCVNPRRH